MIAFQNDMFVPIFHFLNKKFNKILNLSNLKINLSENFTFNPVKYNEYPIYKYFNEMDKTNAANIIKFNVSNEYAVNLFRKNQISYTDIYKIIVKKSSLNLNYKLNNIKDIVEYHELLEQKIYES